MADAEFAGVAAGIEEHRGPIEGGVEADDESERSGAANRQASEEAEQAGAGEIFPTFEGLSEIVQSSEADGQKDGCRPEADAVRQGAEQVSAEGEFFRDADAECCNEPPKRGAEKRTAVNRYAGDAIAMKSGDESDQERNSEKAPEQALPELWAKKIARGRYVIIVERGIFDAGHDESGGDRGEEEQSVAGEQPARVEKRMIVGARQYEAGQEFQARVDDECDEQPDEQTPAGTDAKIGPEE